VLKAYRIAQPVDVRKRKAAALTGLRGCGNHTLGFEDTMNEHDPKPLRGVRVLDLSRLLPGPFCTLLLADLGAEVIKVEDTGGGDYIRAMGPSIGEETAYFLALNPGKKSIALNLKVPGGLEAFRRLAATANVILEGFRPGTAERLGIGFEKIRETNPRIVYCSISGYGQDGPLRDRAGHDLNYVARAGILGLCGREGHLPTIPPVQVADLSSGMYAAVAVLAALRESERSGRGRFIDISMMDSAMSWLVMTVAEFAGGERGGRGRMPLTGKYPCYNVYRTKDGHEVTLAALESKFWTDFCKAAGRPDIAGLQYDTSPGAFAEMEALFAGRGREEWAAALEGVDCCVEFVAGLEEALADVQARARGMVGEIPRAGKAVVGLGHPLRDRDGTLPGPAPGHGEQTSPLLRELGYSEEEIEALAASGAILRPRT
jgi:crotonobetainyl-CoA:carnitine CoA-transferase CaiB-like acyl-CoA transferase